MMQMLPYSLWSSVDGWCRQLLVVRRAVFFVTSLNHVTLVLFCPEVMVDA